MNELVSKEAVEGVFSFQVFRDGKLFDSFDVKNGQTREGVEYGYKTKFLGLSATSTWYVGLGTTDRVASDTDTASTIAAACGEITSYTPTNRVQWVALTDLADMSINNAASPAVFTLTAATTIRNVFLVSTNIRNGTTGILTSTATLSSARSYEAGDVFQVMYKNKITN
jgi:hypothetical protein